MKVEDYLVDLLEENKRLVSIIKEATKKSKEMLDKYYESNMAKDMENISELLDILEGVDKE